MKKNLLAFLLCIVGLHGAYATDFSASYVSENDTAEHITLIKDLKIDPHNPTENDEIFLRSHLMTNSSYKQQVRIVKDTIFINGNDVEIIGTLPYYKFKNGVRYAVEIEYKNRMK